MGPVTGSAGAYLPSPGWEAVMVQVPVWLAVTVVPETVHTSGVSDRNDTVSSEDAVAVRVTGLSIVALAGGVKLIVCGIFWTAKDWVTDAAGTYLPSPGWEAVMVQVPAWLAVTVVPEMVHTSGVLVL